MRVRVGYQLSITALFMVVVLAVGLGLVVLSFDRARAITRSAALTFIHRVAEHTADRVDGQFKVVRSALARRTEKWTRFSVATDAPARGMEHRINPKSGSHFSVRCSKQSRELVPRGWKQLWLERPAPRPMLPCGGR